MSDELDPGLRRLFAETSDTPADEAFVQGVTARTSRERKLRWAGRGLIGVATLALLAVIATALAPMLEKGAGSLTTLVSTSPVGWAVGLALALAGVVCVRTLAPLMRMRRN
jgi:hypothetical protein